MYLLMVLRWFCSLSILMILLVLNIAQVVSIMIVLFFVTFLDFLQCFLSMGSSAEQIFMAHLVIVIIT